MLFRSSKEPVVLVASGTRHAACVTSKGVLYTWGNGKHGELGDGFQEIRLNPQQINLATHGGEPAVMVSCGTSHTVVLTETGCVWTCGDGRYGKLRHGNDKLQLTLKLVSVLEDIENAISVNLWKLLSLAIIKLQHFSAGVFLERTIPLN